MEFLGFDDLRSLFGEGLVKVELSHGCWEVGVGSCVYNDWGFLKVLLYEVGSVFSLWNF